MKKKIVLGNREDLSLSPIDYQWAFKYFTIMSNNFWLPSVVNMVRDSVDYTKNLTKQERHLLHNVLGYLSTADVVAMRNVATGVSEKVTAVEVEMCITTIAYQESVHTMSYQHILDSLSIPADKQREIYNYYQTTQVIKDKIDYSTKIINDMLVAEFTSTDDKGFFDFIHGYWYFSQIFEGCLFVNGFNPVLSMNRRNLMSGTAEQFNLIRQDEELHKAFGAKFITAICEENNYTLCEDTCRTMMKETELLEDAYIQGIMPDNITGYTIKEHMNNFRFLANRRMAHFGMRPVFEKTKRLSWHDVDNNINREANFFERTSTDYSTGTDIMSTF